MDIFLLQKNECDSENVDDKYLRNYVMNDNQMLEQIYVYSWIYPYFTIVIMRDYAVKGFHESSYLCGVVSNINSFSLAVMISSAVEEECILDDLGIYSTECVDDEVVVKLHLDTELLNSLDCYKQFAV